MRLEQVPAVGASVSLADDDVRMDSRLVVSRLMSPTIDSASTCSSIVIGTYSFVSGSRNPRVTSSNAPMAVKCPAVSPCSETNRVRFSITSSPLSKTRTYVVPPSPTAVDVTES